MGDEYFGWQHVPIPVYAGVSDDYLDVDPFDENRVYQPTDWAFPTSDIEKMWIWVQKESDERAYALAEMWRRVGVLLQSTRENLRRHAEALAATWQSPAGTLFMQKVGASLYSIDEWKGIADDNARGLELLGDKIKTTQENFRPLWEEYLAEQRTQEQGRADDEGIQVSDLFGINNADTPEQVKERFHERAVNLVQPLGEMFIDTYLEYVSRGGRYKGPTDATIVDPDSVPIPVAPVAGPTAPPGLPDRAGAPPGRPNLPDQAGPPTTPQTPAPAAPPGTPPRLPDGVSLAGGTVAPPAPPTAPGLTTPPPATPPAAVAPVMPPGGPRPATPGGPGTAKQPNPPGGRAATRPAGPPRPTLPGAGAQPPGGTGRAPGSRGKAPGRPTLPGSTGPGGPGTGARPGAPGAGRTTGRGVPPSSPQLPGSTAGRPGKPGGTGSGGRPAPPPSLGGQRGPGPGARPGTPTGPQLPGRGNRPAAPGTATAGNQATKPNLTGRGSPGGRPATPGTAPGPALSGRRGQPARPTPTRGGDDQRETWAYGDGDDELWQTEQAPSGTIDTPAEHRPQDQGRTLGQS